MEIFMMENVRLEFPCLLHYVPYLSLCTVAVGSQMSLGTDQIEEFRKSVLEAYFLIYRNRVSADRTMSVNFKWYPGSEIVVELTEKVNQIRSEKTKKLNEIPYFSTSILVLKALMGCITLENNAAGEWKLILTKKLKG